LALLRRWRARILGSTASSLPYPALHGAIPPPSRRAESPPASSFAPAQPEHKAFLPGRWRSAVRSPSLFSPSASLRPASVRPGSSPSLFSRAQPGEGQARAAGQAAPRCQRVVVLAATSFSSPHPRALTCGSGTTAARAGVSTGKVAAAWLGCLPPCSASSILHRERHPARGGAAVLLHPAGTNCREAMSEGKRSTSGGLPPLRDGNICIWVLFVDALREPPGDSLRPCLAQFSFTCRTVF
jgi:hypothetical protein